MLVTDGKDSAILLDSRQSREEQNFFCAHELIHSAFHRDLGMKQFSCYEKTQPQQDSAIEWQANEGAAELLVPYKLFIPRFIELLNEQLNNPSVFYWIRIQLAKEFDVSYQVIFNRIENHRYEISQYEQGVDSNSIQLLSKRKQNQFGIACPDYNAMCEFEIHFA